MDSGLPLSERIRVRVHLVICQACRRFASQVRTLRRAARELGRRAEKGPGA